MSEQTDREKLVEIIFPFVFDEDVSKVVDAILKEFVRKDEVDLTTGYIVGFSKGKEEMKSSLLAKLDGLKEENMLDIRPETLTEFGKGFKLCLDEVKGLLK